MQSLKKYILLVCLVLFARPAFSQNIYFPKTNYADSISLEKRIPALSKSVIAGYQQADTATYTKNLGYLLIAAEEYDKVDEPFNKYAALKQVPDSTYNIIEMAARVYCQTMMERPSTKMAFKQIYRQKFTAIYSKCKDLFPRLYVDKSYTAYQGEYDIEFKSMVKELRNKDSLNINNALNLCMAYARKLVYAETPLRIGKSILDTLQESKYTIQKNILLRMPDGGNINITIVRDKKMVAAQPVVMEYNIYSGFDLYTGMTIANNGYVGVVADTRGKTLSPDAIEPLEHDAEDAYFIIDWISKQPWCNGKIGMFGGSYLGFSQWASVKHLHPALKTIVPQVAVGAGIDFPMQNGIFRIYSLRWLHYVMDTKFADDDGFGDDNKWDSLFGKWYRNGNSFRSLDSLEGRPNYIFQRWLKHPGYDSYWQNMTPQKQEFAKINIPVLTISGYWDDDQLGALYYYRQHNLWNKNANAYLLIGPYDHGGSQGHPRKILEGYKIDSVANISISKLVFQWMDYVLKDSSRPSILMDKVNFEVMGKNEWRHVSSLDKMHNDSLVLFLGNTADGKQQYPLLRLKPDKSGAIDQIVDFKDRSEIRFKGGDIDAFEKLIDTVLIPEKEKLFFISDPIEEPFAISGPVKASLKVNINKPDIDLVMDIYEQTTDGKFFALNENMQRASYINDREQRELLQTDKEDTINLTKTFITSRLLQKGSRIIVLIGINKSPEWQMNYGTGKDVSDETINDANVPLQIRWLNTSYIQFPIIK